MSKSQLQFGFVSVAFLAAQGIDVFGGKPSGPAEKKFGEKLNSSPEENVQKLHQEQQRLALQLQQQEQLQRQIQLEEKKKELLQQEYEKQQSLRVDSQQILQQDRQRKLQLESNEQVRTFEQKGIVSCII